MKQTYHVPKGRRLAVTCGYFCFWKTIQCNTAFTAFCQLRSQHKSRLASSSHLFPHILWVSLGCPGRFGTTAPPCPVALCDSTLGQKSQTMWALVISKFSNHPKSWAASVLTRFQYISIMSLYSLWDQKWSTSNSKRQRLTRRSKKHLVFSEPKVLILSGLVGSGRVLVASLRMSQGNPMLQTQWSQCTMFSKKTRWFSPCPLHVHFHVDIRWVCWRMSLWAFELCEPQGFCGFPCISVCSTDSAVREPWLIVEMKLAISGNLLNFMSFCAIWIELTSFLVIHFLLLELLVLISVLCRYMWHAAWNIPTAIWGSAPFQALLPRVGQDTLRSLLQSRQWTWRKHAKAMNSELFRTRFVNHIVNQAISPITHNHIECLSRIMSHIQCQYIYIYIYMSIWYHIITKASLLDGVGFSNVCLGGRTSNGSLFQFNSKGRTTAPHLNTHLSLPK